MSKEQLNTKVPERILQRLEQYAEQQGYNRSEAARRLLEESLAVRLDETLDVHPTVQDRLDELEKRVDELSRNDKRVSYHEERLNRLEKTVFDSNDGK